MFGNIADQAAGVAPAFRGGSRQELAVQVMPSQSGTR